MAKRIVAVTESDAVAVEVPTVDFDVWFAMRAARIPANHLKEIVWADFKGRGLTNNEMAEVYDAALAAYGVRL